MTKLEFTNKVIDNLNSSMALNGKIKLEKFIDLTNKQYEAINYTPCCKSDSEQLFCGLENINNCEFTERNENVCKNIRKCPYAK